MSLLERVEALESGNRKGLDEHQFHLVELREALYRRLPSQQMAELISKNKALAMGEVGEAVDSILRDRQFSQLDVQEQQSLKEELLAMVLGFGPIEALLEDEDITEIMVNSTESVFYERDGRLYPSDARFMDEEQIRMLIDRIIGPLGRRVDEQCPYVNARLPQGHRVNIIIPPLGVDGSYVTIRKFRERAFSMEELVRMGTMDTPLACFLSWAVLARKSLAVSGGTGSGKTTLLNALSMSIPISERIITIEDSAELRFQTHPHVVRLEARPRNAEGTGEVTIRDLLVNALRMRPDRIIVGECRSVETIDMLQAMNTGHEGSMTTLHANSSREAISRLTMMSRWGMDLPIPVIQEQIASALDLIVQLDRLPDGSRKVTQVVSCINGGEGLEIHPVVHWEREVGTYQWEEIPEWVGSLNFLGIARKEEVEQWRTHLR